MIDFGYGISPSSAINLDKFDRTRFEELAREEPDVLKCMACGSCADVLKCMACGSCAASCPTAGHSDMNLRRVILLLGRGREGEVLRMVSHCMLCGKCLIVCPRGINTRHLILSVTKIYQKK